MNSVKCISVDPWGQRRAVGAYGLLDLVAPSGDQLNPRVSRCLDHELASQPLPPCISRRSYQPTKRTHLQTPASIACLYNQASLAASWNDDETSAGALSASSAPFDIGTG